METEFKKRRRKILFDAIRAIEESRQRLDCHNAHNLSGRWPIPFPKRVLRDMFLMVKGATTLEDVKESASEAVSQATIDLTEKAYGIRANIFMLRQTMREYAHLFPDYRCLVYEKNHSELMGIIDGRVSEWRAKSRLDGIRTIIRLSPERAAFYQNGIARLEQMVTLKD